jgi:hypothetical protein
MKTVAKIWLKNGQTIEAEAEYIDGETKGEVEMAMKDISRLVKDNFKNPDYVGSISVGNICVRISDISAYSFKLE